VSVPFLLEIGVEEIPDWMIQPALKNLEELFTKLIEDNRLGGKVTRTDGTPRRLTLMADGLIEMQEDRSELVTGPAKTAPAKALEGFARKAGVTPDQLELRTTDKGEYWTYTKTSPGRATIDILSESLAGIIGKIYFPKAMYWTGRSGPRFIRPIRWVVSLFGDQVVPFEFAEVHSGNTTSGHRLLGDASIKVSIATYEELLRKNFVVLSADQRRKMIESSLDPSVQRDDSLLQTLVYLTEYPVPIRGEFDKQFLRLPEEILTTVMRHHQRYFSVHDNRGDLAPQFVAVMNTSQDPEGLVRKGNERVLRARFNDARFFWEVDLRRSLADRVEDLGNITYQAKLGTYLEKTRRMTALAKELSIELGVEPRIAQSAALLSKCDLTTDMVKEFTELQGIVGGLYARQQGESDDVWQAIYDQYKPVSMEDSIPRRTVGQVVALADKIDTLRGCFGIGLVPTGSKDPFALRRAAQGVVKIIVEGKLRTSLKKIAAGDEQLEEFLLERARYYFKDIRDFKYDEINAVLASGSDDLLDVETRLEALRQVRPTENFEPLAASFKRIQNILVQSDFLSGGQVDETLLEPGPETDLYREFTGIRTAVEEQGRRRNYEAALELIASLRPKVDLFFDKVLVNAPDENIRRNRLTLLNNLLTEFSSIAEFSEIVTTH
jgi:glycyl-tRNA synthetase beta chain